jgi:hypothetical protein
MSIQAFLNICLMMSPSYAQTEGYCGGGSIAECATRGNVSEEEVLDMKTSMLQAKIQHHSDPWGFVKDGPLTRDQYYVECQTNPDLTTLDALTSAGCTASNAGTCAFCAYSHGATDTSSGSTDDCKCNPTHLEQTKFFGQTAQGASFPPYVCFANFKEAAIDQLCIWTDFSVGRNNPQFKDPSTMKDDIEGLLTETATMQTSDVADTVAFHYANKASVAWSHLHYFKTSSYPTGIGPDGLPLDPQNCFFTKIQDDKAAMADDLAKQIQAASLFDR